MCWHCYDADKRELALPKTTECDGVITPILTMGELIEGLTLEWIETGKTKTRFRFFREGLLSTPAQPNYSWVVNEGAKKSVITVDFI